MQKKWVQQHKLLKNNWKKKVFSGVLYLKYFVQTQYLIFKYSIQNWKDKTNDNKIKSYMI